MGQMKRYDPKEISESEAEKRIHFERKFEVTESFWTGVVNTTKRTDTLTLPKMYLAPRKKSCKH